jgi:hypothetical protein
LAKFRQIASSSWNTEKGFPGAGITCTVGPSGGVAHALTARGIAANTILTFMPLSTPKIDLRSLSTTGHK